MFVCCIKNSSLGPYVTKNTQMTQQDWLSILGYICLSARVSTLRALGSAKVLLARASIVATFSMGCSSIFFLIAFLSLSNNLNINSSIHCQYNKNKSSYITSSKASIQYNKNTSISLSLTP